jgi:iron complex outermembrane receptor protein
MNNDRVFFAPSLTWNISPDTQANFELQYKHSRDPVFQSIPAVKNDPSDLNSYLPNLPRHTNLLQSSSYRESDDTLITFNWTHAFNEKWKIRNNFYADWTHTKQSLVNIADLLADQRTLDRYVFYNNYDTNTYGTSLDLTGELDTFGIKHNLLLGTDYFNYEQPETGGTYGFSDIDIYTGQIVGAAGNDKSYYTSGNNEDWFGVYFQDQITLPYHFHLLAGFRYDNAVYNFPLTSGSAVPIPAGIFDTHFSEKNEVVKPRFGLLWQPIKELSLYGNYVENFGGQNVFNPGPGGIQLKAQTASEWEVGIKTELFDKRLTGSLAWFDLTKKNIPTPDPFNPNFSRLTGEAENQGLELDLAGEIVQGLRVIGAYTYIDSKITKDSEDEFGNPIGNQGHAFYNIPRHGGSLWTTYEFQKDFVRGLKVGGGIVARSERQGNNENTYQLPGYMIGNLLVSYAHQVGPSQVTLQLNVNNITDEKYWAGSQGYFTTNVYGMPRAFLGSIKVEF